MYVGKRQDYRNTYASRFTRSAVNVVWLILLLPFFFVEQLVEMINDNERLSIISNCNSAGEGRTKTNQALAVPSCHGRRISINTNLN